LGYFIKNQVAAAVWIYFCVFGSVPLVFMSVRFSQVPCCFYSHDSGIGHCNTSSVTLFAQIALAIHGLLFFQMDFRVGFSICDECHWNFEGITLNILIAFGKIAIFMI
jgi:hypothetical protein